MTSFPYLHLLPHGAIFGFSFPYLPDFLEDHTLVGERKSEKVEEVLTRQIQFIAALWRWQGAAFSLRYLYHPQRVALRIALLARIAARPEHQQRAGEELAKQLLRLGSAFGMPLKPVADREELQHLLSPFAPSTIVELRQHEEVVPLTWLGGDAYVVHALNRPAGSFLLPFLSLGQYDSPILINLHLQPTQLTSQESQSIARAAGVAQTASDWQKQDYGRQQSRRFIDPQAQMVAQIYTASLRRLARPFLVLAQVASPDPVAAMTVAQSLSTAITSLPPSEQRFEADPPVTMDALWPTQSAEIEAARQTMSQLTLRMWGPRLATEGKERFRYLTDAQGAACLFRFPISVQGGIPGIVVRQQAPDFVAGSHRAGVRDDEVHLGVYQSGGNVTILVKDLTRHGMIAGLPGSGKTNTALYILDQLWRRHRIPFMVIEPAKCEYRGLCQQPGYEDLLIFTLGDEMTSPFRLNPFELLTGVRVEAHLEMLNVAINAALPQFGVLPTIIEEALENVYSRYGWELTDRAQEDERRLFPTLADFYREAIRVVQQRGYRGELNDNITAAVKGRLGSLLRGSKGMMFNCRRSLPFDHLLSRPVILEMDALSDDAKGLTMMFLLILLREYRRRDHALHPEEKGLRHLLLIEEAHRVMENVQSVGASEVAADTRAKAVKMITDFLVEMRAYGQGMLIAEQSPEKLAPDAVRNTNLKIAHMLPGRQDRAVLASSMIMDEHQEWFMGKLRVGQAAVFMTGFEKATFMRVPNYKDESGFADYLLDDEVSRHMARYQLAARSSYLPFDGCRFCGEPCRYRKSIEPVTRHRPTAERFQKALLAFDKHPEPEFWPENWRAVAQVCLDAAARAGYPQNQEAAYCYLAHEIDFLFTEHMRRQFIQAAKELTPLHPG